MAHLPEDYAKFYSVMLESGVNNNYAEVCSSVLT